MLLKAEFVLYWGEAILTATYSQNRVVKLLQPDLPDLCCSGPAVSVAPHEVAPAAKPEEGPDEEEDMNRYESSAEL